MNELDSAIQVTKALGERGRMRAILALTAHDALCVCQITALLRLSWATVSRHMNILHRAGLVITIKKGRWVHYSLSKHIPPEIKRWILSGPCQSAIAKQDRERLETILAKTPRELCNTELRKKRKRS